MKDALKYIAIVIIVAIVAYFVMPQSAKANLTGRVQMLINEDAKNVIPVIQNAGIIGHETVTYKQALEKMTTNYSWVYSEDSKADGTSTQKVTFQGSKAQFTFGGDAAEAVLKNYTLKMEFIVTPVQNSYEYNLNVYLDGSLQNDERKEAILQQLYNKYIGDAK